MDVIFYEKPGCRNNSMQKKLLKEAGHRVQSRNLLAEPWTAARLLAFFNGLPVHAWFNESAPAVKSSQVDPYMLTAELAIQCMLADPLLIRRPLMEIGEVKMVGFEPRRVRALFNVGSIDDVETCSKRGNVPPCKS